MIKNSLKIGVMSAVVLTMSATVAMAYNEAGPTALGGTATNAPVCSSEKPQKA